MVESVSFTMISPLRIGSVARDAGVRVPTLRYYERLGLLRPSGRTAGGFRTYASDAAERVLFIRRAQDVGFTLAEIRDLLALRVRPNRSCATVKRSAEATRERVRERLKELRRVESVLTRLLRACDTHEETAACPILEALGPTRGT
jgi:DNA-binding transcriptional MerR regulator